MTRPIRALLFTLVFLALAELGLRVWEQEPAPVAGLPDDSTLCFVLGTSRTMRGLDPLAMEETLRENGVATPFVANIAEKGITTFSLYDLYIREIQPLAVTARRRVTLGIELRASGLNDHYATTAENEKWDRGDYRTLLEGATGEGANARSETGRTFDPERLAKRAFGTLALANGREVIAGLRRSMESTGLPAWATGRKGFDPFTEPKQKDMKEPTWRRHYQDTILKDFHFGDRQFPVLQALCTTAKADGVDVFLYVMPVTAMQRAFWNPPELRAQVLDRVKLWAKEVDVPVYDFDTDHTILLDSFFDTHHLTEQGAKRFSRRFAVEALLPK